MTRYFLPTIVMLLVLSATASHAQSSYSRWLRGTWEGVGYQMDTDSTWPMKLVTKGNLFTLDYPSLNCSGRWRLLSASANLMTFREVITVGRQECTDRGTVVVQRLSRRQIAYRYYIRGVRDVTASAILNRK